MSEAWRDCVVTLIDVIDIRSLSEGKKGGAASKMRQLHKLLASRMGDASSMPGIAHAYAWNDSVLLLGFLQAPNSSTQILAEISEFKKCVDDQVGKSYAVSVKGQTFPEISQPQESARGSSRCTVLRASSYAMANCFLIEKQLKTHRADWYIDSRLSKSLSEQPFAREEVSVMPVKKKRCILMFKGYFHLAQQTAARDGVTKRGT